MQKHASLTRQAVPPPPHRDRDAATGTVLCLANYPANTGYAWDYIEGIFARVADRLAARGIRTFVAYPSIESPPRSLRGSAAEGVVLDGSLATTRSRRAVREFVRREHVRVICLVDRSVWSFSYLPLRWAGARHIIVYDHTSGERKRPRHLRLFAKWLLVRFPGVTGDVVVAVSDYVARRQREVGLVPHKRVVRVYNGLEARSNGRASDRDALQRLGIPAHRPVIICACRATPEKGVDYLLRAFDRVTQDPWPPGKRPVLLYLGGGPHFDELLKLRNSLRGRDDVILAGSRTDAKDFIAAADICVVPSIWQEAFALSVIEPMAYGKPVIGTKVGAIPELIADGVTGLLVAPADEASLADALRALLADPQRATRMGTEGCARVAREFTRQLQESHLVALFEAGLGIASR
jgi:glycosyltransferase involved in cell wall biosynthesis